MEAQNLPNHIDPYCSEWDSTSYDKKLEILEKVLASGEELEGLVYNYIDRYREQNRNDIAASVDIALAKLLEYKLKKQG